MALRTGSLADAAAVVEEDFSRAAEAIGTRARCAPRAQQAAERKNFKPREEEFPRFRKESEMVMKSKLPLQGQIPVTTQSMQTA
jgi:hypothetical protein